MDQVVDEVSSKKDSERNPRNKFSGSPCRPSILRGVKRANNVPLNTNPVKKKKKLPPKPIQSSTPITPCINPYSFVSIPDVIMLQQHQYLNVQPGSQTWIQNVVTNSTRGTLTIDKLIQNNNSTSLCKDAVLPSIVSINRTTLFGTKNQNNEMLDFIKIIDLPNKELKLQKTPKSNVKKLKSDHLVRNKEKVMSTPHKAKCIDGLRKIAPVNQQTVKVPCYAGAYRAHINHINALHVGVATHKQGATKSPSIVIPSCNSTNKLASQHDSISSQTVTNKPAQNKIPSYRGSNNPTSTIKQLLETNIKQLPSLDIIFDNKSNIQTTNKCVPFNTKQSQDNKMNTDGSKIIKTSTRKPLTPSKSVEINKSLPKKRPSYNNLKSHNINSSSHVEINNNCSQNSTQQEDPMKTARCSIDPSKTEPAAIKCMHRSNSSINPSQLQKSVKLSPETRGVTSALGSPTSTRSCPLSPQENKRQPPSLVNKPTVERGDHSNMDTLSGPEVNNKSSPENMSTSLKNQSLLPTIKKKLSKRNVKVQKSVHVRNVNDRGYAKSALPLVLILPSAESNYDFNNITSLKNIPKLVPTFNTTHQNLNNKNNLTILSEDLSNNQFLVPEIDSNEQISHDLSKMLPQIDQNHNLDCSISNDVIQNNVSYNSNLPEIDSDVCERNANSENDPSVLQQISFGTIENEISNSEIHNETTSNLSKIQHYNLDECNEIVQILSETIQSDKPEFEQLLHVKDYNDILDSLLQTPISSPTNLINNESNILETHPFVNLQDYNELEQILSIYSDSINDESAIPEINLQDYNEILEDLIQNPIPCPMDSPNNIKTIPEMQQFVNLQDYNEIEQKLTEIPTLCNNDSKNETINKPENLQNSNYQNKNNSMPNLESVTPSINNVIPLINNQDFNTDNIPQTPASLTEIFIPTTKNDNTETNFQQCSEVKNFYENFKDLLLLDVNICENEDNILLTDKVISNESHSTNNDNTTQLPQINELQNSSLFNINNSNSNIIIDFLPDIDVAQSSLFDDSIVLPNINKNSSVSITPVKNVTQTKMQMKVATNSRSIKINKTPKLSSKLVKSNTKKSQIMKRKKTPAPSSKNSNNTQLNVIVTKIDKNHTKFSLVSTRTESPDNQKVQVEIPEIITTQKLETNNKPSFTMPQKLVNLPLNFTKKLNNNCNLSEPLLHLIKTKLNQSIENIKLQTKNTQIMSSPNTTSSVTENINTSSSVANIIKCKVNKKETDYINTRIEQNINSNKSKSFTTSDNSSILYNVLKNPSKVNQLTGKSNSEVKTTNDNLTLTTSESSIKVVRDVYTTQIKDNKIIHTYEHKLQDPKNNNAVCKKIANDLKLQDFVLNVQKRQINFMENNCNVMICDGKIMCQCKYCDLIFNDVFILYRHLSAVHNVKEEKAFLSLPLKIAKK